MGLRDIIAEMEQAGAQKERADKIRALRGQLIDGSIDEVDRHQFTDQLNSFDHPPDPLTSDPSAYGGDTGERMAAKYRTDKADWDARHTPMASLGRIGKGVLGAAQRLIPDEPQPKQQVMADPAALKVEPRMSMSPLPDVDTMHRRKAADAIYNTGKVLNASVRPPSGPDESGDQFSVTDQTGQRRVSGGAGPATLSHPQDLKNWVQRSVAGQTPGKVDPKAVLARARGGTPVPPSESTLDAINKVAVAPPEIPPEAPVPAPPPAAGPSNGPAGVAAKVAMAAAPQPTVDQEMLDAQAAREHSLGLAGLASGFQRGADLIRGAKSPDGGDHIRATAGQPIEDLKAARVAQRQTKLDATNAEQAGFERNQALLGNKRADAAAGLAAEANKRAGSAESRAAEGFGAQQRMKDPKSRESQAARDQAAALYPKLWSKVPPEQRAAMSADDLKTFFGEASFKEMRSGSGSGGKPLTQAQLGKLVPADTLNIHEALQGVRGALSRVGGWDKADVGGLSGLKPGFAISTDQRDLRQNLGSAASMALSARGGKAITKEEDRVILGKIAANPGNPLLTSDEIRRGFAIIERYTRNNLRQGLAAASPEQRAQMYDQLGVDESWVQGNDPLIEGAGSGGDTSAQPGVARKQYNAKTKQTRYLDAQGNVLKIVHGQE